MAPRPRPEWGGPMPAVMPPAPRGPMFMPEYRDERSEKATATDELASQAFEAGVESRERAEHYVRVTALLSSYPRA